MNVEIIELPAMRVATVPYKGPYSGIGGAFGKLGQIAGAAGLFKPGAAMLGIYHDNPQSTPPAELRSEAAVSVDAETKIPAGLVEATVPAGRYARAIHVGPYEQLPGAWPQLIAAVMQGGHQIRSAPSLEIYRNTPGEVPSEQLITELYEPVT